MTCFQINMQEKINCKPVEIFRTVYGTVQQCNLKNTYLLDFYGQCSAFKASDFLDFVRKVNNIDLEEMVRSTSRNSDIVILMPHYTERCFVLSISEVLNLRELLQGAKFILNLNSMLCECLRGSNVL